MSEEWRPVLGWEELYEVSSEGRVRSLDRLKPNPLTGGMSVIRGRVLRGRVNRGGYRQVTLSGNSRMTTRTVHRMVAQSFIPNPKGHRLVLHGPSGSLDNTVTNLRWGSNSDNMRDKRRDGTDHGLNKTHCPQRHEYTEENTSMEQDGSRKCRECVRKRARERYWRLKEGAQK